MIKVTMFGKGCALSPRPRLAMTTALLIAMLSTTGCAFAPGSHMDYQAETADIDELVDIQPITPGLVASYRAMHSHSGHPMPAELREAIDEYVYRVGKGDVLDIIVYDHPELTSPAGEERGAVEAGNLVRNDGTLFYPYIGRVNVSGLTLDEIRDLLTRRLSTYLTDPQVDVKVAAFRSKHVYISGEVGTPGQLPITTEPLTVLDALSQVGGATSRANWHRVILTRDGQETQISLYALMRKGDQRENHLLRDGDVIHITSAEDQGVAVMGQVLRPGNVALGNERLTLTNAISRSGGINETSAEASGIFVIRSKPESEQQLATVYQLDVKNAAAFTLGQRFILEPGDIVYVTTAPVARWNRVISLLLPSVELPGSIVDTSSDISDR
ncbi:polysaccharide export protein [Cobetia amphilecti]|uniref:polysaccharide export protein n=1 Tax=Cobetia amphilecti TaxID=1055104 RepID=UPI0025502FC9|nr:polysaccharide export protein [Cobetia amphilecti]